MADVDQKGGKADADPACRMRPYIHCHELRATGKDQRAHQRCFQDRKPLGGRNPAENQAYRSNGDDKWKDGAHSGKKFAGRPALLQHGNLPIKIAEQ
ncbi:hypothetical protein GCM10007919_33710 [Rhizobium indigoferae]|nr:hypothetical protein GCM10007919_33710 [Rhizobium indigoferae]